MNRPVKLLNGLNKPDETLFVQNEGMSDTEKIQAIQHHFESIMKILGLDLTDESLKKTPERVATMYVKEIFSGLDPANYPKISVFENSYGYNQMLVERHITFYSYCEHHFVPIIGKADVAYFPDKKVIGLSKINRLVQYFARRPQVQEKLTVQIANGLKETLQIEDVAVRLHANHLCVSSRGINDVNSSTITSYFGGRFDERGYREEFLSKI